ncbi:unnamed protein product [Lepeophtheirus salmonis]|uniref:(salmon louse) hypothetical protein n=1 Tax=Lepeophtheirus salmonis TaxID=72036 RepID=A0A7R8D3F5_LEPSM|nr:unnamed protein product [Lepeophtheirus salmonis]CAF3010040.1 unnamed protein product [Lepeophtheirus salmonis]
MATTYPHNTIKRSPSHKSQVIFLLLSCFYWVLALCVKSGSGSLRQTRSTWSMDQPKVFVDYVRGPLKDDVNRFEGNDTTNNFKMIIEDLNILIIGATNTIYFLDTRDLMEIRDQRISWRPEKKAFEMCLVKGENRGEWSI